jgi:ribosomal protein S18 acetylase RimI-like enzyme
MQLREFADTHLPELMCWFPDAPSCAIWAGPGFRFPFTPATFREDLRLDLASFALQDDAGALLGFGQHYLREGRCHLARLAIAPQARGRGAGAVLIRELLRRSCRALATRECSLFVLESNTAARRLYTRLGFAPAPYPGGAIPLADCLYLVVESAAITGEDEVRFERDNLPGCAGKGTHAAMHHIEPDPLP